MTKIFAVISVILIIVGFGILHNKNSFLETLGSVFIGLGTLYFLFVLWKSSNRDSAMKKKKD